MIHERSREITRKHSDISSITQDLNKTERLNMREVSDLKTVIKSIRRDHVKTLTKAAFQLETAVTALGYTTDQTALIGPTSAQASLSLPRTRPQSSGMGFPMTKVNANSTNRTLMRCFIFT